MDGIHDRAPDERQAQAGLCAVCVYARAVPHPHGGAPYWRCGKHDEDKTYAKYPRLPVTACAGFSAAE